ncbi:catechol 2,3-dioxygenase-like lactoylglutathione lyase family enzyme [Spinactinospora alkalitolerans]|uniref:Catechol 2,3-dioxygenase-like lactoylglutathione lyase family enzyme n=1 Tax=Spinactinospora alkalitolerans TaxID=687207 RepID=A0A852U1U7_9ACTN|nr:VOC family protein [Spinactinospora alkalitolerans]NYE48943.1 catechol 2,3-dioxygenase-like lactoylglutathione lyase family enzyme [Spinactinospora alkalitolerans]
MPQLTGLAHITLSVRDRDASVEFYRDVLGFRVLQTRDEGRWLRTTCRHPSGLVLGITQHLDHFNSRFDHRHAGVDHLSFGVGCLGDLETWEERLTDLDIDHSPIVHCEMGSLMSFIDPDGFQLELHCSPEPDTGED